MHLVQLNMICLEAEQRIFKMTTDFISRQPRTTVRVNLWVTHATVNFGREYDFLSSSATLGKPTPDNFLGPAPIWRTTVYISGIEKVHACVERCIHYFECFLFLSSWSKIHRS
ncbi:hypothetical protein D3C78_1713440 [compost metagenome]